MVKSNQSYYRTQNVREEKEQNGYQVDTFEPIMLFANRRELYIANGSSIEIYNPIGGSLIEGLEGHSGQVISICRNVQSSDEGVISCDDRGHVFEWYTNRKHPDHGSSFPLPVGEHCRVTHFSQSKNYCIFAHAGDSTIVTLSVIQKDFKRKLFITKGIKLGQSMVAISADEKYIAALKNNALFVTDLSTHQFGQKQLTRHHRTGYKEPCCVAFHPTKNIVATGCKNGAIILWYEVQRKEVVNTVMHWHTMPLRSFCFSGNELYSGGEECVLVRWSLQDSSNRSFLPRLGMPIQGLQADPSNSFVAVFHSDNSISIIDSQNMRLDGSIQRMSKHIPLAMDSDVQLTIGLLYHSPSASFIKNGRTGHLQFFNPQLLKVNYNLDITMSNYATAERHRKLPNVEITDAAVSEDGLWLVTVERCCLTPTLTEVVMKYWNFIQENRSWELNTSIQTPHLDKITSLTFGPHLGDVPMCVSCSEDKKFKVWQLIMYEDVTGKLRNHWNSRVSREFRSLAPTACGFAMDGSLFAVSFENVVTLWTPEEVTMKRLLTQPYLKDRILDIKFSHGQSEGSALVTRSEDYICSWDLLSCSLMWRVYIKSSCMAVDTNSGLMAVFSKNKEVYFFEPKAGSPVPSNYPLKSETVCAQFAPYNELTNEATRKKESRRCLYYFDKQQNFLRLDLPSELAANKKLSSEDSVVESIVESIKEKKKSSPTSTLMSKLSAKTKHVTKKIEKDDEIDFSLVALSSKYLLKDLKDIHVNKADYIDLTSTHMMSTLQDLRTRNEKEKSTLSYNTIDQREEENNPEFDQVYLPEKEKTVSLQNADFMQMSQNLMTS